MGCLRFVEFVRDASRVSIIFGKVISSSGLYPSRVPTFLVALSAPRISGPKHLAISGRGRVFPLDPSILCIPSGMVTPFVFGWDRSEGYLRSTGAILLSPGPGASNFSGRAASFTTASSWRCSSTLVAPDNFFLHVFFSVL